VRTALTDGSGVLDTVTSDVGGGDASGSHEVRTRAGATAVRVTVTDAAGNDVSESVSV
jgi:hypothetical protein